MNESAHEAGPAGELLEAGTGPGDEAARREAAARAAKRARSRRRRHVNLFFRAWFMISLLIFSTQFWAFATGRIGLAEPEHAGSGTAQQISPQGGYTLPARFGDLGPRLLAAGAIDYARFVALYEGNGNPLSPAELDLLQNGSDAPIVINAQNSGFLLNFFWALGLTNQNAILTQGRMMQGGVQQVVNFASTGGWTLAAKPIAELYASAAIVPLTAEQHNHVEEVASGVYRPCCNNPTHFPDCNHGMAMLGLLQVMASQGASVDEMYTAAKYVNAFWFPQQTLEVATLFRAEKNVDFAAADAREIVGRQYMSAAGFQAAHQTLTQKGLLQQAPSQGGSCGV